jgi:hypothetical protein
MEQAASRNLVLRLHDKQLMAIKEGTVPCPLIYEGKEKSIIYAKTDQKFRIFIKLYLLFGTLKRRRKTNV